MLQAVKYRKKLLLGVLAFIVLAAVFGALTYQMTKKTYTVVLDGQKHQVTTHADTVAEAIKAFDVQPQPHDKVSPSLDTSVTEDMKIRWEPAIQIAFSKNHQKQKTWTTADTVQQFLQTKHINVQKHDTLNVAKDQPIEKGMTVAYANAVPVTIDIGTEKGQQKIWSTAGPQATVKDLLQTENIHIDHNDIVKPAPDTSLQKTDHVAIDRIKVVEDVVQKTVAYDVVKKEDDSLLKGKSRVVEPGQKGKVTVHYQVTKKMVKRLSVKR